MRLGLWLIILLIPYAYATVVVLHPYRDIDYSTLNVYTYGDGAIDSSEDYDYDDDCCDDEDYLVPSPPPYIPLIFRIDTNQKSTYY